MKSKSFVIFLYVLLFFPLEQARSSGLDSSIVEKKAVPASAPASASSPAFAMSGKYKNGEILLRWAPTNSKLWAALLEKGAIVERWTFSNTSEEEEKENNNCKVWNIPPLGINDSILIAQKVLSDDKNSDLIAAMGELLFAPEIDYIGAGAATKESAATGTGATAGGGKFSALSQKLEAEQNRYGFCLMMADRSFSAACLGKLALIDSNIDVNSAYLYRIYIPGLDLYDTASIFVRPKDGILCPPPEPLSAKFSDGSVSLSWDTRFWQSLCYGYIVERAENKGNFSPLNNTPISNLQLERKASGILHYTDSLPQNGTTYRYRIIGLDLFGDTYIVSKETKGSGKSFLKSFPLIVSVEENKQFDYILKWNFPLEEEATVKQFSLSVKNSIYGEYRLLGEYSAKERKAIISSKLLDVSSYFCLSVYGKNNEVLHSPTFFYQITDSTPPDPPQNLKATIDTNGCVILNWQKSATEDAVGYRIFRSTHIDKEPIQISSDVCYDTTYTDTLSLRIWQPWFYSVVSIDARGNNSDFSALSKVSNPLPNPIAPPIFSNCNKDEKGVELRWFSSMDQDVVGHKIYVEIDGSSRILIADILQEDIRKKKEEDSLYYTFTVKRNYNSAYTFYVSAYTADKQEQDCPYPFSVIQEYKPPIPKIEAYSLRDKKCIALEWNNTLYYDIDKAYIYKKTNDNSFILLYVLNKEDWKKGIWPDFDVSMNNSYEYRIQLQTTQNEFSSFSAGSKVLY